MFGPGVEVYLTPEMQAYAASYGKPADPSLAQATAARLALTPTARATVAAYSIRADPRVAGEAMFEDLTTDLRPAMAGIATPITLVYPVSAAMPRERADSFYLAAFAKAQHMTYVAVADSGHFVMLDQPVAFAAAVQSFLQ